MSTKIIMLKTGVLRHFARTVLCDNSLKVFNVVRARKMSDIKSLSVVYNDHGDPNKVLKICKENLSRNLNESEVLVKMLFAPCNPSDINMIEGTYLIKPKLPAVVGNEGVGEVLDVGSSVQTLQRGDWVIPSEPGYGTWRTHGISNESNFRKIRNDIPPLSAATISVNPCTAYRMLKDFGNLGPGDTVIQNSANSGVGQSVIQIAKYRNLKTINIVRDRENFSELETELKLLGATHVVTEEFCRTPEMKQLIESLNSPPKLALNGVGGKSSTELLRHLGNQGIMVTYGGMSRKPVVVPTGVFIFKEVTTVGYWNSQWNYNNAGSQEQQIMFDELCQMIRECRLVPPRCEIHKIENFADAVKSAMKGFSNSKKIISMGEF